MTGSGRTGLKKRTLTWKKVDQGREEEGLLLLQCEEAVITAKHRAGDSMSRAKAGD